MKFKVGDKVKVKGNSKFRGSLFAGKEGIVKEIERGATYPYWVRFNRDVRRFFPGDELEKLEE